MRPLLFACLALLAACGPGARESAEPGPFPALVSIAAINARAEGITIDDGTTGAVVARLARLRARAALVDGAPVDDATRARLAELEN